MNRRPTTLQAFFAEMKRRRVFRVMAVYGAVAFVVLQVADLAFPRLGMPEWTITFVLMLSILGFPVAVVLAWAFEQSPQGLRRTEEAEPGEIEAIVAEPMHRRWPAGLAALAGIALLVGGAWWLGQRSGAGVARARDAAAESEDRRSIAVLPLATRAAGAAAGGGSDASSDAGDVTIFADGMHDDLLTQLSRIDDLRVTSRTSVEEFRDTEVNIREIAGRLGVRFIVEGSVDRIGDQVRVNIQLIDAETDEHVWASTYQETMTLTNLFAIRDDLTRRIATSLRATLSPEVRERIAERPTENAEAFELYTRARHLWGRGARPDLERAIDLFRRAAELDPQFASAWAGLAGAYFRMLDFAFLSQSQAIPAAEAAVERALSIDPEHTEALTYSARLQGEAGRFAEARQTLERVLDLNPSSARAHASLGYLEGYLGYENRALEHFQLASELDPLAPDVAVNLANALNDVGRIPEAIERAAATLELHPDYEAASGALDFALVEGGRAEEAIEVERRALARNPASIFANEGLAWAYLAAGRRDEALDQIRRAAELVPDDYPIQGSLARMLADAGRFMESLQAARRPVRLAPEYPGARVTLARALLATGDTAEAVAHLDSAAAMDALLDISIAEALFEAGRVDDAVALSRRIAAEQSESVRIRTEHARFLAETAPWASHDAEASLEAFAEARSMSPREDYLLRNYGQTLRELGRTDESIGLYRTLVEGRPQYGEAHMALGWELLMGQRNVDAAAQSFRRAVDLHPRLASAHWGLARVTLQDDPDSAYAAMQRARDTCGWPRCVPYFEVREAWLRAAGGDTERARELLRRYGSMPTHPDFAGWLPVLAVAHAELGESDEAFRLLDRAYALRSSELLELRVEPWFDPLRADPRFGTLLQEMGME